jgi:iron uptake system component EfeO
MSISRCYVVVALCLIMLAACGTSPSSSATSQSVTVTIHDNYFDPASVVVPPGKPLPVTFVNQGANVHIVEIKGLTPETTLEPGQRATFTVTAQARSYKMYDEIYSVDGMTGSFTGGTAGGSTPPTPTGTQVVTIQAALTTYRAYVQDQVAQLVSGTLQFTTAVQLGDLAQAKALYAPAHQYYERIEPIAELFPTLDLALDARENYLPAAQWRGFHRMEKALWIDNSTTEAATYAPQLVQDVQQLQTVVGTITLHPTDIIDGAVALLDEAGHTKITGEEDRYSHTDLYDLAANVEGAQSAFEVFHAFLAQKDAGLLSDIETKFQAVNAALAPYRVSNGFVSFNTLTTDQTRQIAQAIDAVAEPLALVGAQLPTA